MNFITNGNAMPIGLTYFEDASQTGKKRRYISQALKRKIVMQLKLITFLLTVFLIQVKGAGFAQPISLKEKNTSLEKILQTIERQSGYVFFYNNNDVRNLKASVVLKNASIEQTLKETFRGLPLAFKVVENTVVIRKTDTTVKTSVNKGDKTVPRAETEVKGQVLDEKGEGLPGVSIRVKGSNEGTTTDVEGNFALKVADGGGSVLLFSFIGYVPQEVPVNTQTSLKIVLQIDNKALDEVVVVGYGTQKKANVVSSISSVNGSQITFPTRNLTNNLAGQMAGLMSIQRTGEPGRDDAEFWIRGVSTFAGGTAPLVLVDGVPRSFSNIEPDEIETFSVLKDAAATAVYGAEGANGVILVTTKRGGISKPQITFRTEHSFSTPTRLPEFVDSWQYLELANEALTNDGLSPMFSQELIAKYKSGEDRDLYPNANWLDEMLVNVNRNQRYTLNFRGGTEKARYFVSGAYFAEDGVFKNDPQNKYETNIGLKRYNLRSNIDMDITPTTLLNVDISGQYLNRNWAGVDAPNIFSMMLNTPSYIFPAVYSDGTLATYPAENDDNNRNPYNQLFNSGYKKEWNALLQTGVGITQKLDFITPGLHVNGKISFDYDGTFSSTRTFNPNRYNAIGRDENGNLIYNQAVSGNPDMGEPVEGNSALKKIYMEASLNYKKVTGNHTFNGMLLYMQKEMQYHDQALAFRKQGIVGRATYGFADRYFIEGNFGYTGSETFAKNHRFGFFPAVGIGYLVTNEPFFPDALKRTVSSLKIRASAGRTGNDNTTNNYTQTTARFLYRPTFRTNGYNFNQGITSGGGSNGLGTGINDLQFENPNIHWEIENKANIGMDLSLFGNQIELVVDYFKSKRSGILLQRRTIPGTAGFWEAPWDNYGSVKNQGVDGSLNARHTWGKFKVGMRGTFSFSRNKILEYDELPQPHPWMSLTGTRVNENTLYIAERLYTNDDFHISENSNGTYSYQLKEEHATVALQNNLGPGDIKYADLNEDGVIDAFDRKRVHGHPYKPEIIYGFGANVEYNGFYVSAFFQGTGNTSVLLGNGNSTFFPFNWGYDKSNYRSFMLDRWSPENPSQDVVMPRLHQRYERNVNKEPSTWWLRNGSFLRFKNLEVGYNVPKAMVNKIKAQNMRVYMMGYNLTVWDKIKYWDPETGNNNAGMSYPLPRTLSLGLDITF